jgi:phosphoglycerate dehydrogenase-like enzyme
VQKQFTIWTNAKLPAAVAEKLSQSVRPHRLLYASEMSSLNLAVSPPDAQLAEADIAFGQPDVEQIFGSSKLRWIHLTPAGYTAYDREDLRRHLQSRGIALTNSSGVYDEPCSQHVVAMMMAFARQLPASMKTQWSTKDWPAEKRRYESFLLNGQTAILFGFGEIATRLCELLAPFRMNLIGVRRRVRGV